MCLSLGIGSTFAQTGNPFGGLEQTGGTGTGGTGTGGTGTTGTGGTGTGGTGTGGTGTGGTGTGNGGTGTGNGEVNRYSEFRASLDEYVAAAAGYNRSPSGSTAERNFALQRDAALARFNSLRAQGHLMYSTVDSALVGYSEGRTAYARASSGTAAETAGRLQYEAAEQDLNTLMGRATASVNINVAWQRYSEALGEYNRASSGSTAEWVAGKKRDAYKRYYDLARAAGQNMFTSQAARQAALEEARRDYNRASSGSTAETLARMRMDHIQAEIDRNR
jgi:hypothetical protein